MAAVQSARERRDDLAAELDKAQQDLRVAIRDAYDSGAQTRDIAAAAGLTRQRVHQIWRELTE